MTNSVGGSKRRSNAWPPASAAQRNASIRAPVNRQIGRILQQNQRAAARFAIALEPEGCLAGFCLRVAYNASFDDWATLSEGAYLLRSNINDWSDQQLWKASVTGRRLSIPLLRYPIAEHLLLYGVGARPPPDGVR